MKKLEEKSEKNIKNSSTKLKNTKSSKNKSESKKSQPAKTKAAKEKKSETKATKTNTEIIKETKKVQPTKKEAQNIKILGYNNLELNSYIYDNVVSPKAVVIIVHGMMEHCLRYKNFAEFLNEHGYIVIASDLRGHGKTAPSIDKLGFGEDDIFQECLKDQINIINFASEKFKLPIYLFGHSYGSMLSQYLIQLTPIIQKCVLCGTANGSSMIMKLGKFAANLLSPFKDEDKRGGIVEKLCIKNYGNKFERGNWFSRDEKVFDDYQADEYCGGSFPFSFYKSLVRNMAKANRGIDKIGTKKLFLIAGSKDPVGSQGKQVKQLYKIYLKNNVNAKIKIYPEARHELLNEINKDEVYQDVLSFFDE